MARKLVVEIIGDDASLRKALARSTKETKSFQAQITRTGRSLNSQIGAAAGVTVGLGTLVTGVKTAVAASSALAEQTSKTNQVFGQSAAGVESWSKTTAKAMGLSERAALEAASSFGALFGPLGVIGPQAAKQSETLTQLSSDLASFYDTSVQDALDAIRSGLVGESEPLRRYGVLLSEARVQQEALAETGKKSVRQLTDQDKVFARITLILRDTTIAQGDFARTSGGLANQQRSLSANIENTAATIGTALTPAVTDVVTEMNDWFSSSKNQQTITETLATSVALATPVVQAYADAVGGVAVAMGQVSAAYEHLPKGLRAAVIPSGVKAFLAATNPGLAALIALGHGKGKGDFGGGGDFTEADLRGGLPKSRFFFTDTPPSTGLPYTPHHRLTVAERRARRNAWFDAMIGRRLDRVQDIATIRGQIQELRQVNALIKQRLAITNDITRQHTLEDRALDVSRTIGQLQKQVTQAARQRYWENKRLQQRRDQVRQERRLGWLEFALERAEDTKPLADNLKVLRLIESYWKQRIRHEGRTLHFAQELYRTRKQIRDLNKQNAGTDPLAGLMQVSSKRLATILGAGLGLGAGGLGRLQANIAGAEISVTAPVILDGAVVARNTSKHQARTGHRTARQTSGYRG